MSGTNTNSNIVEVLQSESIERHYTNIRNSMKPTVVALLQTGQCVWKARRELNNTSFKTLAEKFGSESSLSKWIAIGERADAMMTHVDALPSSHTSLYHLSRLPADKFQECVVTKEIHADMTNASAAALLASPPPSSAGNLASLVIKFDDLTRNAQQAHPQEMARLLQQVSSLADSFRRLGATVKAVTPHDPSCVAPNPFLFRKSSRSRRVPQ